MSRSDRFSEGKSSDGWGEELWERTVCAAGQHGIDLPGRQSFMAGNGTNCPIRRPITLLLRENTCAISALAAWLARRSRMIYVRASFSFGRAHGMIPIMTQWMPGTIMAIQTY